MKVWATMDEDGRRDIWDRLPVLSGRGKNKFYIVTNGFNLDMCDEVFDALFPTGMKPGEIRGPFEIKRLGEEEDELANLREELADEALDRKFADTYGDD